MILWFICLYANTVLSLPLWMMVLCSRLTWCHKHLLPWHSLFFVGNHRRFPFARVDCKQLLSRLYNSDPRDSSMSIYGTEWKRCCVISDALEVDLNLKRNKTRLALIKRKFFWQIAVSLKARTRACECRRWVHSRWNTTTTMMMMSKASETICWWFWELRFHYFSFNIHCFCFQKEKKKKKKRDFH